MINAEAKRLKMLVNDRVDAHRQQLSQLSHNIHSNPELGFQENKAVGWLSRYLEGNGFAIDKGICELSTAFKGSYGNGKPAIALLAEYDALPQLGHACGHNLIATSAAAAAAAVGAAIDHYGGSILVIGTPAEELYGGKIIMADRGAFDDIDVAMIVHPGTHDTATTSTLACASLEVEFFGREAHAAAHPESGINALEAMLLSFAALNSLRQHIKERARIHGIITDGGQAANIVPAHSSGSFLVRAEDETYLEKLKQKVLNCFAAAAQATGARLEYRWGDKAYAPMHNNLTLARLFMENMKSLGRPMEFYDSSQLFGSTDMGNVSRLVPSIHPFVAIAAKEVVGHSREFARAAASSAGSQAMTLAAKALAMTVVDLLASPEMLLRVREEFEGK